MTRNVLIKSKYGLWLLALLGGMWTLTSLSACNTVEGMGEDVEDVGEGVSGAARGADDAN